MANEEKIEKLLNSVGAYIENKGKSWRELIPSPWTSATFTDKLKDRSAPIIKFSFANGKIGRSGDYNCEMPLHELRKAIGAKVETISVKMTPDGELLLKASDAGGNTFKRGGWRCMVSSKAAKPPKPTSERRQPMANETPVQKLLADIGEKLAALDNLDWPVSTITVRANRYGDYYPNVTLNGRGGRFPAFHDVHEADSRLKSAHLRKLAREIGANADLLDIRLSSNGALVLKAFDPERKTCNADGWRCQIAPLRKKAPEPRVKRTPALVASKDVTGVPLELVAALRRLHKSQLKSHPSTPPEEIPVKFWNTRDTDVFYDALQTYPLLVEIFDNEKHPVAGLPAGYRAAYLVFRALWQRECEGLATAIANCGTKAYREVAAIYRKAGLTKLADLYLDALAAYDKDSYENPSREFVRIRSAIAKSENTQKHANTLIKYFYRPELFETR
jgi:hypothetical protein